MNSAVRKFTIAVTACFFAVSVSAQSVDPKLLSNFHKVNDNLFRGAEPKEGGIVHLKALGIKTVIDAGNGTEDSAKERQWVESSGMRYINIHLHNWFKSSKEDIDAIVAELEKPENHPVFFHCKRGKDRTGTVVAIYRMRNDRWLPKQALDEAKTFGMGWWQWWMKDFVNDYYRDRIAARPPK